MVASMPSSSSNSRRRASRGCSPSSILPPGNSHFNGMVWWRVRWHTRISSALKISAATTRFMDAKEPSYLLLQTPQAAWRHGFARRDSRDMDSRNINSRNVPLLAQPMVALVAWISVAICPGLKADLFQPSAHQRGAVLDQFPVVISESGGKMAVDIQFAGHLAADEYRHHDFRFGFGGAGEITAVHAHVIDYHCLSGRSGRAANTLIQWNAGMRRHGALQGPQDQHAGLRVHRFLLQHVEAHPVVLEHAIVQQLHYFPHQVIHRARRLIEPVDLVLNFRDLGSSRHRLFWVDRSSRSRDVNLAMYCQNTS